MEKECKLSTMQVLKKDSCTDTRLKVITAHLIYNIYIMINGLSYLEPLVAPFNKLFGATGSI